MKILVTGNYEANYNRTLILLKGLKKRKDIEIVEYPLANIKKSDKKLLREMAEDADFIYFPPFTHSSVRSIKKVIPLIPIVFDPLISKYLTKITDYKQISKYSPRAFKNYLKDKIPLKISDVIIADTEEHKKYFYNKFGISPDKIFVLPIGVDTTVFFPDVPKKSEYFEVGFYGGFIPLQGVKKIVETAFCLRKEKDIRFKLAGSGFETQMIQKYIRKLDLKNIDFLGMIEYHKLPSVINSFDICLGIFGDTPKADLVIPNKIFHYAAVKKCIITKNTLPIKEIFTDQLNIILSSNQPEDIAEKILYIRKEPELSNKIAVNAFKLVSEKYNQNQIADKFINYLMAYKRDLQMI